MNVSAPFIQRPIATALVMVGLLAGGLIAYPLLPAAALPNVNYPTLSVTAQLPGADPQTMADLRVNHFRHPHARARGASRFQIAVSFFSFSSADRADGAAVGRRWPSRLCRRRCRGGRATPSPPLAAGASAPP